MLAALLLSAGVMVKPVERPYSPMVQRANFRCGIPPIPQIGCQIGACVCDGSRCYWQQICR